MMQHDKANAIFKLAADLVEYTSQHIFLTGKAGTGKTTFLKHIKEYCTKNTVVVAPTGVAAINAGGVTMHSLFQLPFAPYIPVYGNKPDFVNDQVVDKHDLFRKIRFNTNKRELLQELEVLIIDEVSMVRCDVLDALDGVLRHVRKQHAVPFGGVQLVYIGDMFQLPPVVQQHEWNFLQQHYEHAFFFNAKVITEAPPLYIELKKIYRQTDQSFIDILNRIRNNTPTANDLQLLNDRCKPDFDAAANQYITLSTHNYKADKINESELKKLNGELHSFEAEVEGEFNEFAYPTEKKLFLKEGAQIMFIKNDSGSDRRYFNGKLGIVKRIDKEGITVSFSNSEQDLLIEKETWKNIRYIYEKENDEIKEEELGTFKQYPIRLAWAITIHKSQGLTFHKAVIDAGAAFAAGQVYVALSRCTSLEGIVLYSKIHANAIATDPRIIAFAANEANNDVLVETLEKEKQNFQSEALMKVFLLTKIQTALEDWCAMIHESNIPDSTKAETIAEACLAKANELSEVADKFIAQLKQVLNQSRTTGNTDPLKERLTKAVVYFSEAIFSGILQPLQQHMEVLKYASKVKRYLLYLNEVEGTIFHQLKKINNINYGDVHIQNNTDTYTKTSSYDTKTKKGKKEKRSTYKLTLELHRQGNKPEEIADIRNLAKSTILSHLSILVSTGEVNINDVVEEQKLKRILDVMNASPITSASDIKAALPDDFTYTEIKAAFNFLQLQQKMQPQI